MDTIIHIYFQGIGLLLVAILVFFVIRAFKVIVERSKEEKETKNTMDSFDDDEYENIFYGIETK